MTTWNAPKFSAKYLKDKICNIKLKVKHLSKPEYIFKPAKNFLEKRNLIEDSSKTTISKILSKISNRKKTLNQQYNFCKAKISLEVYGM